MSDDSSFDAATVTRSGERLRVSTRPVETGRAVLRKSIVTEERTITVQVRHEEAHLDVISFPEPQRVDQDHDAAPLASPEFVLHREEITISKTLVPVERVRLHVDRVTEHREITAELRAEHITVEHSGIAMPDADDGSTPQP